jgi:hypothetical protein
MVRVRARLVCTRKREAGKRDGCAKGSGKELSAPTGRTVGTAQWSTGKTQQSLPRKSPTRVTQRCNWRLRVPVDSCSTSSEAQPGSRAEVVCECLECLECPEQAAEHSWPARHKKKRRYFLILPPCLRIRLRARSRAARKQRGIHDCRGALVERVAKMLAHHPGEKAPAGRGRVTAPNAWRHRLHLHFPKARHGDCRSALQLPATPFSHFWAKHPIHGSWIPRVQILLSLALQRQSATPFLLSFTMAR